MRGADWFPFLFGVSALYGYLAHQVKNERKRADRAEQVLERRFDPVADLAAFPAEEEHEQQVDPGRDEEEADEVEMALFEAVEQRDSTAGFGGFASFGFRFRFAFGFAGRGALLSNEHGSGFDTDPASPVRLCVRAANPL